jgi:ABC-2 type transport system ATP-binding protein
MISARALSRDFVVKKEKVHAVRGIDLDIGQGELVAFLGPNGAGKSTTLRMLTTLLPPTSGTATVAGHDIVADPAAVRHSIGYIGQGNGAGHNWRVRDELVMQGRFYGMSKPDSRARADELMEGLELADLAKRAVSTLSGGQRRRLDVAMGMMHRPPLLFLDEPSTGMDPQNRANLWEHVLDLHRQGTTIVLTTHYLEEADAFAERVVVIDHGEIIADDTAAELKAELAGDRLAVSVALADEQAATERITRFGSGLARQRSGDEVRLEVRARQGNRLLPGLLQELSAARIQVRAAESGQPTLDDVFLSLTGRSLREHVAADSGVQRSVGNAANAKVSA